MIAPEAGLSVSRQCALLGVARSGFYYRPRPESAEELAGCRWRSCERGFRLAAGASGG